MKPRYLLLVCAASLLLSAPAFSSTTAPQTFTVPSPTLTDWSNVWNVGQFDSTLGTLTGISLDLSGDVSAFLRITNSSTKKDSSGTANGGAILTVDGGGLNQILNIITSEYAYSLVKNTDVTSPALTGVNAIAGIWTASAILSQFTGPGTIALDVSAVNFTDLHNVGGTTYIGDDSPISAGATVSLVYFYEPQIPEPATIAVLSIGAFAVIRKKHR